MPRLKFGESCLDWSAGAPIRGHLTIRTTRTGPTRSPDITAQITTATLAPAPCVGLAELLPCLHDIRVTRISAEGIVVVGVNIVGHLMFGQRVAQAWWCRPVDLAADII